MCLAIPGRVESIREDGLLPMGRMRFGDVVKEVCLACLPGIAVGDYAIVHVGFAIARIDEASAAEALHTFAEIEQLEQSGPFDQPGPFPRDADHGSDAR